MAGAALTRRRLAAAAAALAATVATAGWAAHARADATVGELDALLRDAHAATATAAQRADALPDLDALTDAAAGRDVTVVDGAARRRGEVAAVVAPDLVALAAPAGACCCVHVAADADGAVTAAVPRGDDGCAPWDVDWWEAALRDGDAEVRRGAASLGSDAATIHDVAAQPGNVDGEIVVSWRPSVGAAGQPATVWVRPYVARPVVVDAAAGQARVGGLSPGAEYRVEVRVGGETTTVTARAR